MEVIEIATETLFNLKRLKESEDVSIMEKKRFNKGKLVKSKKDKKGISLLRSNHRLKEKKIEIKKNRLVVLKINADKKA